MSRHTYECQVRFSDVDVYGHVNNVKYFEYYQEARIAFIVWLAGGLFDTRSTERQVVARVDVDYKRPILFRPEPYAVETWVSRTARRRTTCPAGSSTGRTAAPSTPRRRCGWWPSTWAPSAPARSATPRGHGSRAFSVPGSRRRLTGTSTGPHRAGGAGSSSNVLTMNCAAWVM